LPQKSPKSNADSGDGKARPESGIKDALPFLLSNLHGMCNVLINNALWNKSLVAYDMLLPVAPHERGQNRLSNVTGLRGALRPS
jgi:hypothetical protein